MLKKDALIVVALAFVAGACVYSAWGTAEFIYRTGLFAERPPLPIYQVLFRVVTFLAALALLRVRRDPIERMALLFTAIGVGASALFGFGVRSAALSAVRLVFHFLAYSMGAVVSAQWLLDYVHAVRKFDPRRPRSD